MSWMKSMQAELLLLTSFAAAFYTGLLLFT